MSGKAGLDKDNAGSIEEKASKEVEQKAQEEKKKDKAQPEVAKNPELPAEEKVDSKDVADVLAPVPEKKEEKVAEKASPEEEGKDEKEEAPEKKEAAGAKKEDEKKAEIIPGVKKVEDPKKKKEAQGKEKKEKVKEAKPKDKLVVANPKQDNADKREAGDAFFVASLAALLQTDRNMLERNVKENADRTYTVTFYEKDPASDTGYKPHEIVITPETPGKETDGEKGADKTDRLTSMVKQAYTKWKGGEDKIGEGKGGAAMEAMTGQPADFLHANTDAQKLWSTLVEACNGNKPVMATALGEHSKALFKDSDVKPWHVYVVLKCKEANGKNMVTLRNPYGRAGANEGNVIEVDLEKFAKLYRGVTIGQSIPDKEAKSAEKKPAKDEAKKEVA